MPDRGAVKINVLWNTLKMYSGVITMCCTTKSVCLKYIVFYGKRLQEVNIFFLFPP